MEKHIKNRQLVGILNGLNDPGGRALLSKRLPAAVVFALRRNITWVESAYRDQPFWHRRYRQELVVLDRVYASRPELEARLTELLDAETTVSVQAVSLDALSRCGDGGYDALSVADLDRLDWMLEEGAQ